MVLDGSDEAFSPEYDYLSLVSVLHASPTLDTFILSVSSYSSLQLYLSIYCEPMQYLGAIICYTIQVQQGGMKHDSASGDTTTNLRTMPGHKHERLKEVMIIGFCSATSMVELTCHILENTTSLETITLDAVCDVHDLENIGRCCTTTIRKTGSCYPLRREMILEAHRGVMAIERYIRGKVPSNVELTVRESCTWCHDLERLDALEKENGSHYSPPHLKLEDISLLLKPV